jgi:hypothetical protein
VRSPLARSRYLIVPTAFAALALSAGPAHAGSGYGQLIVNPGRVTPGGTVSILGVCPTNGQTLSGVFSSAFTGGLADITRGSENFAGTAIIAFVTPGTYTVTADCGPGSPSVDLTVAANGASSPVPTQTSTPAQATTSQAAVMPVQTHTSGTQPATAAMPGTANTAGSTASATAAPHATSTAPTGMPTATAAKSPPAAASDGPVTSTGIVRVGLAGNSQSILNPMSVASAIALIFIAMATTGFLVYRGKRKSRTTQS